MHVPPIKKTTKHVLTLNRNARHLAKEQVKAVGVIFTRDFSTSMVVRALCLKYKFEKIHPL